MKIDSSGTSNSPVVPRQPVQPNQTMAKVAAEGIPQDSSGYTPSQEWVQLLDQVKEQPEVREDRVSSVVERLRQGYYSKPEIAMQTAEAMLNSAD